MTKRPHVILEALQVKKDPTGTGRGIMDLCWALAERDRNLDFTVLTTSGELFRELEDRPGWRIRECPQARGGAVQKALFTQFRLPELVREINIVSLIPLYMMLKYPARGFSY